MGPMNHLSGYARNLKNRRKNTFFTHDYSLPPTTLSRSTIISADKKDEVWKQAKKDKLHFWVKTTLLAISAFPLTIFLFWLLGFLISGAWISV